MGECASQCHFSSYALSHVGKVRTLNEDAFLEKPESGIWLVADGMGGHQAGDYASQFTVSRLSHLSATSVWPDIYCGVEAVQNELRQINRELLQEASNRGGGIIGCTVVVLLVVNGQYACLWAGDSRIYCLRHQEMFALTTDHSQVEELVQKGALSREEAEAHPSANVITRAVGAVDNLEVDVVLGQYQMGDIFLLCSDGLYKHVSEQEIGEVLVEHSKTKNPPVTVDTLIQLCLDRGAGDNVTVITVF